jgi:acyl-CoA thioester hydrolase
MRFLAPLPLMQTAVAAEWLDYNGHMNDAAYAHVFSRAIDRFAELVGLTEDNRRTTHRTIYTLQIMLHYFKEAKLGEPLAVVGQLIDHDAKRFHVFAEMTLGPDGPRLAATEQVLICVDQSAPVPRVSEWPAPVLAGFAALAQAHAGLPRPVEVGRPVAMRRR